MEVVRYMEVVPGGGCSEEHRHKTLHLAEHIGVGAKLGEPASLLPPSQAQGSHGSGARINVPPDISLSYNHAKILY